MLHEAPVPRSAGERLRGLQVSAESIPSGQLFARKCQATAFRRRRTALRQNELSSGPPAEQPDEFDAIRGISEPGLERNHHEFGAVSANALLAGIDEPAILRQRPPACFQRSGAETWPRCWHRKNDLSTCELGFSEVKRLPPDVLGCGHAGPSADECRSQARSVDGDAEIPSEIHSGTL